MAKKSSKDIVAQALLLGFGLMDLTKEKVEKFMDDIRQDRKITKKESQKVVKDLLGNLEKNKKDVEKILRKQVKRVINELGLATKEDIEALKRK